MDKDHAVFVIIFQVEDRLPLKARDLSGDARNRAELLVLSISSS